MRNHWKKRMTVLFLCGLLAMFMIGCGANAPAPDNSQDVPESQEEQKQETVTELPAVDDGIAVTGTVVSAGGKTVNLNEKNEFVQSVASCRWLEKNKIAALCELNGNKGQRYYFAVYDVVRDFYVYERYGSQFIWQNDDIDTLVYVLDYSGEKEPSKVCNKKDMVLFESKADEQITGIAFVPKGLKVELTDLRGDNPRQALVEAAM